MSLWELKKCKVGSDIGVGTVIKMLQLDCKYK